MVSAIFSRYKINLLLALLLAIAVIVIKIIQTPQLTLLPLITLLALTILAAKLSAFFLDLDFLYYALITNPDSPLGQGLRDLLAQKNYTGIITYLNHHEDEIDRPILRSALFQVILLILTGYLVSSQANLFGVTFTLGVLLQSLLTGWQRKNKDWFWILKNRPTPVVINTYFLILILALVYLLSLLK